MKLLLDTHYLLWAANEPAHLPRAVRGLIDDQENELFFSAASLWEVAIKNSRGRKDFQADASVLRRALLDNGYSELPVTSEHAVALERLPLIHKDPFDRMLIAQAVYEGVTLLTNDRIVAEYPGPIRQL